MRALHRRPFFIYTWDLAGVEFRTLCMLAKYSTTGLHPGQRCVHLITISKCLNQNIVIPGVLFPYESIDGSNEWQYGSSSRSSLREVVN